MKLQLPEVSYANLPGTGETILITRGESGYWLAHTRESAEALNKEIGVCPAQAEAMLIGSMFGWDVPGADPNMHIMRNYARELWEEHGADPNMHIVVYEEGAEVVAIEDVATSYNLLVRADPEQWVARPRWERLQDSDLPDSVLEYFGAGRCIYCGVPCKLEDSHPTRDWAREAQQHKPDCEWVQTRAHSRKRGEF